MRWPNRHTDSQRECMHHPPISQKTTRNESLKRVYHSVKNDNSTHTHKKRTNDRTPYTHICTISYDRTAAGHQNSSPQSHDGPPHGERMRPHHTCNMRNVSKLCAHDRDWRLAIAADLRPIHNLYLFRFIKLVADDCVARDDWRDHRRDSCSRSGTTCG